MIASASNLRNKSSAFEKIPWHIRKHAVAFKSVSEFVVNYFAVCRIETVCKSLFRVFKRSPLTTESNFTLILQREPVLY